MICANEFSGKEGGAKFQKLRWFYWSVKVIVDEPLAADRFGKVWQPGRYCCGRQKRDRPKAHGPIIRSSHDVIPVRAPLGGCDDAFVSQRIGNGVSTR